MVHGYFSATSIIVLIDNEPEARPQHWQCFRGSGLHCPASDENVTYITGLGRKDCLAQNVQSNQPRYSRLHFLQHTLYNICLHDLTE